MAAASRPKKADVVKTGPRLPVVPFTEALGDDVCTRIAGGESLRAICKDEGYPSVSSVMRWLASEAPEHVAFREQYARAHEEQADAFVQDMVRIADEAAQAMAGLEYAKLQIETRKWVAGKQRPKKYAEAPAGPAVLAQFNNTQDNRTLSLRDRL
ncbi:MAG TPA: hypothetical protein VF576_05865 [Rubricoccaceae bacterium]